MSHPSREELVGFVYQELSPEQHAGVARHVSGCGECREQVASWRDVREALATWKLDERRRPTTRQAPALSSVARWAAAAIVLLASGFALARLTAPPAPNVDRLRVELQQDMSAELARHAEEQLAAQRAFLRDVDGRINHLEQERLAAYSTLREDVETVALQTQQAL